MACSREGTQPAHLQGLWNDRVVPPWNCQYTVNINTQMNYWPAETTALPECHEPLLRLVENLASAVKRTRALGIPLVVGEWGAQTADSGVLDFQHHLLSVMARYGLSWARWNLGQGADPFTLLTRTKGFNSVGADLAVALATPAATMGISPAADVQP